MEELPARIRRAREADLPAIASLERSAFDWPWNAHLLVGDLGHRDSVVLVAEGSERAVLGYALFRRVLDEGELLRLAVEPGARCRGLGRRLQEEGLHHLQRLGVRTAHLEVRCDNEAAIHLYEAAGWRRAGIRRRYYRDGTDALIYRLDL